MTEAKVLIQQIALNRRRALAIARSSVLVTNQTRQVVHQTMIVEVSSDGRHSRSSSSSSISSV